MFALLWRTSTPCRWDAHVAQCGSLSPYNAWDTSYVLYCCVLFHVFLSGDTGIRLSYRAQDGYTGADTVVRLLCSCLVLRLPRRRWCQIHVAGPHTRVARLGAAPAMHERLPHTCKIPRTRAVTNQTNAQLDLTAVADALPTMGLAWPKCCETQAGEPSRHHEGCASGSERYATMG